MKKKLLIIRFSSFGDIVQTRALLGPLVKSESFDQIDWLVRSDLVGSLEGEPALNEVISFDRKSGFLGLIKLSFKLRSFGYDVVYDAHNNLRSSIARFLICAFSTKKLIIRSKDRYKRFLLFKLRKNRFPSPFRAMISYWRPIKSALALSGELEARSWPVTPNEKRRELLKDAIVLVPATAWPMKSWPVEHWQKLVEILTNQRFIILGGPKDTICEDIRSVAPERVINWAGQLSLKESCSIAAYSDFVITADTGLQQVADFAGVKGISLMGPTAFGFTTMGTLKTMEVDLPCRPCTKDGRGECTQDIYQKCMVDITPDLVAKEVLKSLTNNSSSL